MIRAETASVVGIPSKTTWSSTATVKGEETELFAACGFSGDEQAPHEGRKFIRLIEGLQQPTAQSLYQEFEKFQDELPPSTAASFAVLLKQGGKTVLLSYGYSLAGLVRDGRGRWLADGKQEKVILEGEIRPGDLLLLATARAADLNLQLDAYAEKGPEDIAGKLFSTVQSHPNSGEIAVLALSLPALTPAQVATPASEIEQISPSTRAPASPKHLISPEKIAQGVMASHGEQKKRIQASVSSRDILGNIRRAIRDKKTLVRLGIALVVLLSLIIAMVIYRGASVAREFDTVVAPLEQMVQETLALPPEKIGQQRADIQSLVERLKATRVSYGANRRRLVELLEIVEQKNREISGEKALVNLPVFYDFRLVSADFLGTKASREKNRAVFLDSGSSALIVLNLDSKQNETFPREGLSQPRDVVLANSTAYILEGNRIMKSSATSSEAEVQEELSGVQEPFLIDQFADNLYVLDRSGQQIWRVGTTEEASPSGWIRSARGIDFSTITSMTINGSVWLGANDGTIFQLSRGERQNFSVSGLVDPFTSTLLLAATEDGEKLIVVEPAHQRVVVLSKDGTYLSQIESEQIGAVTDVFLSEDEKGVYLVAGSVVYRVEI